MKYSLRRFLKGIPAKRIEDLTNKMFDDWVIQLQKEGAHAPTINGYLRITLAMTKYFKKHGVPIKKLDEIMVDKLKEEPARRTFFTEEQINRVLAVSNDMQWLMISLSFRCGFRINELLHLRLSDFNGRQCKFIGKGRKLREVWITEEIEQRLADWVRDYGVTDYIFESSQREGQPFCKVGARRIMQRAFEKAGVEGFHPHALRHSFATNICRNGAPLPIAQKMLGHARITTTEVYVHSFDGRLDEFFEKYA